MNECKQKHSVYETKWRSIVKSSSFRIIEVILDTILLKIAGLPLFESVGIAVLVEVLCFLLGFSWERLWNKIKWGRKIVHK